MTSDRRVRTHSRPHADQGKVIITATKGEKTTVRKYFEGSMATFGLPSTAKYLGVNTTVATTRRALPMRFPVLHT